eukprot:362012-Chlamydomonas_euryale.AAC.8
MASAAVLVTVRSGHPTGPNSRDPPVAPRCTRTARPSQSRAVPGRSAARRRPVPTPGARKGSPQRPRRWSASPARPQPVIHSRRSPKATVRSARGANTRAAMNVNTYV